jgi:uncharacterized MAPEG superfamily protein
MYVSGFPTKISLVQIRAINFLTAKKVLANYPRAHAISIAAQGNLQQNVSSANTNPKGSAFMEKLKKRLTVQEFAAYERAERCHVNSLENMPLFVAAIFAGLLAEQREGKGAIGSNQFAIGWLVVRVVYCVSYLYTETQNWSYVRTVCYNMGAIWAMVQIGRAAWALG